MYFSDTRQQISFSPVRFGFEWTEDWYTFDRKQAAKLARQARSEKAKELRAKGWDVRLWTLKDQRLTMGGIGSGRPEITVYCSVYMLDATK